MRDEKEVTKMLCCLTMANPSIGLFLETISHCPKLILLCPQY